MEVIYSKIILSEHTTKSQQLLKMTIEKARLIDEFKISIFGTSIIGFLASFIFSNTVLLLLLLILFSISTISLLISIVTDKINDKYNNYKFDKEYGSIQKSSEYYITQFLVKILFYFYLILVLPFILWHQFAQEFEKPYRKFFN